MVWRFLSVLAVTALLVLPAGAWADDDQEQALRALQAGEIVPLREILDLAAQDFKGEMVEVELERDGGRWVYEVKLLCPGGRLVKAEYDARTKELLKAKDKRRPGRRGE
ncbi:MAG: PepSY domain-containing protein [Magnetospirillum sp. WYHS-4]